MLRVSLDRTKTVFNLLDLTFKLVYCRALFSTAVCKDKSKHLQQFAFVSVSNLALKSVFKFKTNQASGYFDMAGRLGQSTGLKSGSA